MSKLDRDLEKQRAHTAELGRAQSRATGQTYQEVGDVPVSDEAIDQADALETASQQSLENADAAAAEEAKRQAEAEKNWVDQNPT